ncbi:TrbM/KikA/MpfK family conjugal transfer protein [Acinetobacter variabilis]|uniref:TrbM/KikA/MpfK family conjugal transfer protein n=1 Tax=Acinetobacter variabilis TaxID=70346 RepID=UPI0028A5D968|nr:TrbM/KikA/MpfK family conjugal transfer protein [Acinetobacter variabilis]
MMLKLLPVIALFVSSSLLAEDNYSEQLLTGDTKLACEAVLCLSTGKRPDECDPALTKYFSITAKKLKDQIKKRRKFLQLCPASKEQGMPELTDAIVNGAGRCDPDYLNKTLIQTKKTSRCKDVPGSMGEQCYQTTWHRISSTLPNYCKVYTSNAYTDLGLTFSGVSEWQKDKDFSKAPTGKWVSQ